MYDKVAGAALPTTGLAAHFAGGLNYLYAALIAFAVVGVLFRGQADAAETAHRLTSTQRAGHRTPNRKEMPRCVGGGRSCRWPGP